MSKTTGESDGSASVHEGTNFRLLVFLTALSCLMFELVVSRLADFHLGASYAYLAIPITFLGLALGSLHVHFSPGIIDRFTVRGHLIVLALVSFVSLVTAFGVFSWLMPITSILDLENSYAFVFKKTLAFIGVLVPPFYVFGRILTVSYQIKREEIGAIYSADFWGAAIACGITPVIFHYSGLPTVVLVVVALAFIPLAVFTSGRNRTLGIAAVVVAALAGQQIVTKMDDSLDYGQFRTGLKVEEVRHAWNEHSRVALIKRTNEETGNVNYKIVHDNEKSNVHVWTYTPRKRPKRPKRAEAMEVPFLMERPTNDMLVMFAGTGAQMMRMYAYSGDKARITGVELNGLVRDMGAFSPEIASNRTFEFLSLENINLVIDEGRRYLATADKSQKFDVIYVGTNAATNAAITGHSRKYLDTTQAYHAYLDLVRKGGLFVIDQQPLERRIPTMRRVFEERGIPDFADKIIVLDSKTSSDDMVISPTGFTAEEIEAVADKAGRGGRKMLYAPGRGRKNRKKYVELITGEFDDAEVLVDDRPFVRGLDLGEYELLPDKKNFTNFGRLLTWTKVTTVLVMVVVALLFLVLASLSRKRRVPAPVLGYLLLTGFAFMLAEIAIIAKLELFLQKPLLSMAAVLSMFLLTSGIGSSIFPRVKSKMRIAPFALLLAAVVALTIVLLNLAGTHLLWLPTLVKLVLAALIMAPLGTALGLFYPYAIASLVANEKHEAVAVTYGISTLASVVGASYAMAAMLEFGFDALLWQAAATYAVLGVCVFGYQKFGGKMLSI